jgi:hypothetical protein
VEPLQTSVPKQRLGKQFSAATDKKTAIEELLGTIISIRSIKSGHKEEFS